MKKFLDSFDWHIFKNKVAKPRLWKMLHHRMGSYYEAGSTRATSSPAPSIISRYDHLGIQNLFVSATFFYTTSAWNPDMTDREAVLHWPLDFLLFWSLPGKSTTITCRGASQLWKVKCPLLIASVSTIGIHQHPSLSCSSLQHEDDSAQKGDINDPSHSSNRYGCYWLNFFPTCYFCKISCGISVPLYLLLDTV